MKCVGNKNLKYTAKAIGIVIVLVFLTIFAILYVMKVGTRRVEEKSKMLFCSQYHEILSNLAELRKEKYALGAEMKRRLDESGELEEFLNVYRWDQVKNWANRVQVIRKKISFSEKYVQALGDRVSLIQKEIDKLEGIRREILPLLEIEPYRSSIYQFGGDLRNSAKKFGIEDPISTVMNDEKIDFHPKESSSPDPGVDGNDLDQEKSGGKMFNHMPP